MAAKTQRKAVPKRQVRTVKRRRTAPARRSSKRAPSRIGSFFLPMFLSFCILVCLTAIGFLGYRTVTASGFFDVRSVAVSGVERSSRPDIERIVKTQTEKSGSWNADLMDIKHKVEKLPFVDTAAVTRVLPNGIAVHIRERAPQAIVRLNSGDVLVDGEGRILASVEKQEKALPFAMTGWDEAKSEKADKENLERVRMYQKMLADWQQFDLAARVKIVDLADLRDPRAITEDAGLPVSIALGRDAFGDRLKKGINAIVGKGDMFEGVELSGQNMILTPRRSRAEGQKQ